MKKTLLTLIIAISACATAFANDVTIPNDPLTPLKSTSYLPTALNTSTYTTSTGTFSVSQQLYFASELSEASSRTITAITFYCNSAYSSESPDYVRRKLRVWMNHTSITAFSDYATNPTPNFENPGTKVFSSKKGGTDNGVEVTDLAPYTLTFDTPFEWDGTSNILVTVFDSTGVISGFKTTHDMIQTTGVPRFLHQRTSQTDYADAGWSISNLTAATAVSQNDRGYVNKITFTFAAAALPPATPDDLAVSATTPSSATLAWSAVEGANYYDLEQSADNENWSTLASNVSGTSYNWTGLSASSTQYARISAKNANGSSAWSSSVTVTTDAVHSHNGINFNKWSSTSLMPTSGDYYLNDDVVYSLSSDITLTGDLNLCLNGHVASLVFQKIIVPDGKTLAIYDNVGGGKITSFYPGSEGDMVSSGLITIQDGGELILSEGEIENTYATDGEYTSIAICNQGLLKLSGAPVISSDAIDIFLAPTIPAKVITIESGKPLTNTTPYKVYKSSGVLTSGWANMSGEDPKDYLVSANNDKSVYYNGSEAALRTLLHLSESLNNTTSISSNRDQVIDVALTRSLTSSQYNTFCLPFNLNNAQLEEIFGVGYDLEEFDHSTFDGETLELVFVKRTSLTEGAPYLIKPSIDVVDPYFEGVTIHSGEPGKDDWDDNIFVYSTYAPTELEGGNKNILFLGANNELFWPESTGNIKGFRAYFEVKGAAQKAARRARIVQHPNAPTGVEAVTGYGLQVTGQKILRDNQLLILRDGKTYNVLGIECK